MARPLNCWAPRGQSELTRGFQRLIIFAPTAHGCGALTGAFESGVGDMMALASRFEFLNHNAGRAAFGGHALRHRLSLHRPGQSQPFAWFDQLAYPINSADFHPTQPIVAIGGGSYDGGSAFQGDLVLWNWVDGTVWRPFRQLPEVVHLSFNADGGLDLLFRPWTDDWGRGRDDEDVLVYPLTLQADGFDTLAEAPSLDPERYMALTDPEAYEPDYPRVRQHAARFLDAAVFKPSRPIWSVGWFDDRTVGWITGERALDLFDLEAGLARPIESEGREVGQAIVTADRPLVQTIRSWTNPSGQPELQTRLLALTPDGFSEVICRPYTFDISASGSGALLGRQVRKRDQPAVDFLTDATGREIEADFGDYDPNRDHLGVDGAPDFYILQGGSWASEERLRVCRVSLAGKVQPLWPILSRSSSTTRASECLAVYIEDAAGPGLIVSGLYAPRPNGDRGFLSRRTLESAEIWSLAIGAAATAMVRLPLYGLVAIAFLDGRLALIEATTGKIRLDGQATVEGAPAVIYSMAAHLDGRMVVGTMAGEVLVTTIDVLTVTNGAIELA